MLVRGNELTAGDRGAHRDLTTQYGRRDDFGELFGFAGGVRFAPGNLSRERSNLRTENNVRRFNQIRF